MVAAGRGFATEEEKEDEEEDEEDEEEEEEEEEEIEGAGWLGGTGLVRTLKREEVLAIFYFIKL